MKKTIINLVLFSYIGLLIYLTINAFFISSPFRFDYLPNNIKFDRRIWQNGTDRQKGQMLNSLLDTIRLTNKPKEQVIYLLGLPDEQIVTDGDTTAILYYQIDRGHRFKYDLIIFLDLKNRVRDILLDD